MDGWFIFALILAGLGVIIFLFSLAASATPARGSDVSPKKASRGLSKVLLGAAVVATAIASFTMISTNTIGIFTEAGAPYTAADNGWEWKRPWARVVEFDASRQFLRFCGDGNNEEEPDAKVFPKISTKIDGNAKADICGTIAWQMKATTDAEKDNAKQLFRDYKEFNRVTANLVYPSAKVAVAAALKNLNPLVAEKNMSVADINDAVQRELNANLKGGVTIQAVDISVPDYDGDTDKAIAQDLAQKALTSLATERIKTNEQESLANKALVANLNPLVLVDKCIEVAKQNGSNPGYCMTLLTANPSIFLTDDKNNQVK